VSHSPFPTSTLQPLLPALESVTIADILATIPATTIILKIDIEGYECKALQPDVILGRTGKQIPYIFLEWGQLVRQCNLYKPSHLDWTTKLIHNKCFPRDPNPTKKSSSVLSTKSGSSSSVRAVTHLTIRVSFASTLDLLSTCLSYLHKSGARSILRFVCVNQSVSVCVSHTRFEQEVAKHIGNF
jgi:hypothetical protein